MMKMMIKISFLLAIIISFSACGYKSSAKFGRVTLGEKVSTTVVISFKDPENSVLIKDALDNAILDVFHNSLTEKRYAQSHLKISILDIEYTPIQYDTNGYIIAYRAVTTLKIIREKGDNKKTYITKGIYDFSIVANAVMTDKERFDAINLGSLKAIKSFIAKVSAGGAIKREEI